MNACQHRANYRANQSS